MSITFATLRKNTRLLMKDTKPGQYLTETEELDRELIRKIQLYATEAELGLGWSTAALTCTIGNPDAAFSASLQYDVVADLRMQIDGSLLVRASERNIETMRQSASPTTNQPTHYYLRESNGQVLSARLYPTPDAAYVIDALVASLPQDKVADGFGSGTDYSPPLQELVARAVEAATAATCIEKMHADGLKRLQLDRRAAGALMADVERLLEAERKRKSKLQRTAHVAPVVW